VAARGWRRRLGAAALAISFCGAARADESLELAPRPGVTETVVFTASAAPRANVVLLVGGNGVLAVTQKNFLLRVRGALAAGGLNVAVVDAPSDRRSGLDPHFRASAEHAKDIAAAVAFVKEKADLPVWLVGTSNGSISAANGAVRLGPAQIAGAVLTSSVWTGGMSLVPYSQIAVPVLVVHNRDDGCAWASFAGAELALTQLANAPAKDFLPVSGGISKSRPCDALAPHGYYGIEGQVVPQMITWIVAHAPKAAAR
jgi:pimeloyl-ACP methyl ester carboxylesterase